MSTITELMAGSGKADDVCEGNWYKAYTEPKPNWFLYRWTLRSQDGHVLDSTYYFANEAG